ncbi:protein FAM166C-like [Chrysoperla carnea]|uniref:protein FAM166C-like n=1 Tax=Chrysoperla carnea TaxID=189513 RepID=UPI001D0738E4|nr:protein FAM166C-like [Chrysoperla carnea]
MGSRKLSVKHATYFPPSIDPIYLGSYPPMNNSKGSKYQSSSLNYFRDYRDETLRNFQMPKDDWGTRLSPYSPRPDVVGSKNTSNFDKLISFPRFDLTFVDQKRTNEIEEFYRVCQLHREYYKDRLGHKHPLEFFKSDDYAYQCAPNMTDVYLKSPSAYVKYKYPPTVPLTYGRGVRIPNLPERTLASKNYK